MFFTTPFLHNPKAAPSWLLVLTAVAVPFARNGARPGQVAGGPVRHRGCGGDGDSLSDGRRSCR